MTRKSNTTAKHKPTTTSRLSDPTAHKLTIHSLNDAQASCSCGGWSFARTGRATRAQIRSEWFMHKKFRTEFACIIPGCTGTKLEGRKYCAAHQVRANGQTLAEKVAEQRAADEHFNHSCPTCGQSCHCAICESQQGAILEALKRAAPWLGKMIADGAHLNSVLPNDCVRTLEMAEAAIRGSAPAIQSEQQYKDTLAAQNDRQRRNNEAQPESQPSKTWTPPNATAFLEMRGCTVQAPCGCLLEPTESGAALYQCEMHERLSKATFADANLITEARELYQNDDIEIDETEVRASRADNGTWVAAWVWVADSDLGPDGKPRGEV